MVAPAGTPAKKAEVAPEPIFFTAIVTSKRPIRLGTIPWNANCMDKSIKETLKILFGKNNIHIGMYKIKLIKEPKRF